MTHIITRPSAPPGAARASLEVARRALRKYIRTPGLSVMAVAQSVLFLFSFRYVFGGAIQAGGVSYVNYLVPGYVATIVLCARARASTAVPGAIAAGTAVLARARAHTRRFHHERVVDPHHRRLRLPVRIPPRRDPA